MKRVLWAVGFLVFLSAAGCGGATAIVSGKVTYEGKPVTSGYVAFYSADGQTVTGRIDDEGQYTVSKAPVGDVKVAVFTTDPAQKPPRQLLANGKQGGGPSKGKAPPEEETMEPVRAGKFVAIPSRYKDPEQSGLNFTVKSGPQTIDLDLKP